MTAERTVAWRRLVLHGFGRYRPGVTLDLEPGFSCLVSDNEGGKSTLVAGLTAVLFGLPGATDPQAWGQARFRNWSGPARFAGELEFTAGIARFRIERNFADHQVRVFRLGPRGWELELAGPHNPGAQRRLVAYEAWLRTTVGIDNRDLFTATFCVTQPLPVAHQVDQGVQQVLAGGGALVPAALQRLADRVRDLTRRTGDLGVSPRNARTDGELERLAERRSALAAAVAAGREQVDSLLVLQEELAVVAAAERQATAESAAAEQTLSAWGAWRRACDRRDAAVREQAQLERSRQAAEALVTGLAAQRQRLAAEFPDLRDLAPECLRDRRELEAGRRQLADLQQRLDGLGRRIADHRAALAPLPDWTRLDEHPVSALTELRRRAPGAWQDWQRFQQVHRQWEALAAATAETEARWGPLDAEAYERLIRHEADGERLEQELEHIRREVDAHQRERAELAADAAALERDFADLAAFPPGVADTLARAAELKSQAEALGAQARRAAATVGWAIAARRLMTTLAGAVLVALLGWVLADRIAVADGAARILAAVVGALVGALGGWRLGRRRAAVPGLGAGAATAAERHLTATERHLAGVEAELQQVWVGLGSLREAGPVAWARVAERLRQRDLWLDRLAQRRSPVPADGDQAALEERLQHLTELLQAQADEVAAAREVFGADVALGLRRWREQVWQRDQLWQEMIAYCQAEFGCAPPGPGGLGGLGRQDLPAFWRRLDALRQLVHPAPGDGGDDNDASAGDDGTATVMTADVAIEGLAGWLGTIDEHRWDEWAARARTWEQQRAGLQQAEGRRRLLLDGDEAGEMSLAACTREVARLTAAVGPYAEMSLDELEARWTAGQALEQTIAAEAARLEGILSGHGVASVSALRELELAVAHSAGAAAADLQRLADAHSGLPQAGGALDLVAVDRQHRALQDRVEALRRERAAAESRLLELRTRIAALQGQQPVNVAAAELELTELEQEIHHHETERDALALAHRELRQAAAQYQRTHRERLADAATLRFSRLTGTPGRRVVVDADFVIGVREPDGQPVAVAQLSQGARDQLWLALRFALADVIAGSVPLPFLFDDPFLNCDHQRLAAIRRDLEAMAAERQILLLSCRSEFREWGRPVQVGPAP